MMQSKTNNSFAMVFPGQGSQHLGMLQELSQSFPQISQIFAEASEVLGYDLWQLVQEGPEDKLNQTEFTQPALLAADVALWRCWISQADAPVPAWLAGHSLGEYSALVCAEALDFTDAIKLVANRGCYMQEAVAPGVGAMAAIIGLENAQIANICEQAVSLDEVLSPANFNAIGQTVIAGHANAVDKAIEMAKAAGAKMAKKIPVSVPSHCALMASAASKLAKDLKNVHINKPIIKVIHNLDVNSHEDADSIRQALVSQLVSPVRWVETMQIMAQQRIEIVVECGPGKVLTGLNKRITDKIVTYPIADMTQFTAALGALRGVTHVID